MADDAPVEADRLQSTAPSHHLYVRPVLWYHDQRFYPDQPRYRARHGFASCVTLDLVLNRGVSCLHFLNCDEVDDLDDHTTYCRIIRVNNGLIDLAEAECRHSTFLALLVADWAFYQRDFQL